VESILKARQEAIARASEILGGLDPLAVRLGLSRPALRAMLDGRIGVPQRLFFELVDIIEVKGSEQTQAPEQAKGSDPFI
jgi:hypothetical protein